MNGEVGRGGSGYQSSARSLILHARFKMDDEMNGAGDSIV